MKKIYWGDRLQKAIPIEAFGRYVELFILALVVGIVISYINYLDSPYSYTDVELTGKISKIEKLNVHDTYFRIGGEWYLIKASFFNYLSLNDSIAKLKGSNRIEIYEGIRPKWSGNVKNALIRKVTYNE